MNENQYDFQRLEAKWQRRWEEDDVFRASDGSDQPKFYGLEFFPYPSGAGLSVGHGKNYIVGDACCRFRAMQGLNVLHPMGWDAFGQPAENEAIRRGRNPAEMVPEYAANYKRTFKLMGCGYDWGREINTSLPDYYRWTQWFFLLLYRRGLAYRATAPINWCPSCATGLANEEVKEGRCWRCDSAIEKRPLPQWCLRITAYADRLLEDLDELRWAEGIKQMQREWIGRSDGAEVDFALPAREEVLRVFTTRPDTLFGATFMVLAPEHPLVESLTTAEHRAEVEEYVRRAQLMTEMDRLSRDRTKTGVFTGAYAVNPATQEPIPIWVADYVLLEYGTGAIMAVPAHDQRDFEFARRFGLPVRLVFQQPDGPTTGDEMTMALPEGGVVVNSGPFNGLPCGEETIHKFTAWLEETGRGRGQVRYKLRDWLISRQRYWGAPIPIVYCGACGEVPVPEDQLPVVLPQVESYQSAGTAESPLATIPEFVETTCPQCGGPARRETDTMGGFACSSWYFLRFADAHSEREFAAREQLDYWLPVDLYIGGAEHAVMHLLYARFWTKVLHDAGYVNFVEPFPHLRNQGTVLAYTPGRRPRSAADTGEGDESIVDWIVLRAEERETFPADQVVWRWVKMSKSLGNVVTPDSTVAQYGADSLRVYLLFVAPLEDNIQWKEEGISGAFRFVNRVWRWAGAVLPGHDPAWREKVASAARPADRPVRRKLHQTTRKVGQDLEGLQFNTALAALMELVNDLYVAWPVEGRAAEPSLSPEVASEALETLTLLLAPFAPHLAEEIWERLGHGESIYRAAWPSFDPAVAAEEQVTIVIQVDGKVRDRLTVPADTPQEALVAMALATPKVKQIVGERQVGNVFVVPGRLINIATRTSDLGPRTSD